MAIVARTFRGESTAAIDLHEDLTQRDGRPIRLAGLYTLLESLERKNLLGYELRSVTDPLGRQREVRYYRATELGRQAAQTEFNCQSTLIERVQAAFARCMGVFGHA